eukprot:CAMPEP_0198208396 /NCGR_PEP_ID=MMETSP1445-20131203/11762_1 /TAXON_ID=36898 /ORGANISM="Pyramimonas sp., Strain CCMP2087" /LENGTH=149 /DNA_ID=CAMNT_0043881781 /DNA_START=362 /DNA_END=811 /DNA_ORIENTATION=-
MVEACTNTASTSASKEEHAEATYHQLEELKHALQKQIDHRHAAVDENDREANDLLERLEARLVIRRTTHGLRSDDGSTSTGFAIYGRDPLQLAEDLMQAASCPEKYQALTSRLLHRKEKASQDYLQLSNPPGANVVQVVDANGNRHVIH